MPDQPEYLTLLEMGRRGGALVARMIREIGRRSPLLAALKFKSVDAGGEHYSQVTEEPEAQRRPLNGKYTPSSAVTTPGFAPLYIYGTEISHDRASKRMKLADPVRDTVRAARGLQRLADRDLVWGNPADNELELPGLYYWAEHSLDPSISSISAGADDGGAALAVSLLRDAIDLVDPEPALIVCSGPLRNLLTGAAENTGVSGFITHKKNEFGSRITHFDNIPIVVVGRGPQRMPILGFNEASAGATPTATSLYIFAHERGEGFYPFQNGDIYVDPINGGVQKVRDLEWLIGTLAIGDNPVVRIKHIGNKPIVR